MSKILSGELIGKRESVADDLLLLSPHQTPLLAMLKFSTPVTQVEHNWFEDEMYADESTVTGAVEAEGSKIKVADAEPFRVGHIVRIDDELIKVTAISGNELTVTRGYAETEAAEVTDGATIEVQFVEGTEGADAREGRYKPRVRKSNITQIFDETIEISGTAQAVNNYSIDDIYEYEKQKKQVELALQLEKAAINGIKYEDGNVRQMGGIRSLINTNVIDAGGDLTADKISDAVQEIYTKGGFKSGGNYEIIVSPTLKRKVSAFDKSIVRLNQDDSSRGTVVNYLTTDFGEFPVSINDNLRSDELFIVDKNRIKIKPLQGREFAHEYLGKKGDYLQGMIVGEYTLEFFQESAHARIKGAK